MTDSNSSRALVLEMLLLTLKDKKSSSSVLKDVLDKYAYLPKTERAFITRLYLGTIERMCELDYYLNKVSNTPVNKMKPVIRNILRMGAYQVFYMDSVPDSAICNEAVNLAGKRGFKNLKGFVNGVLRNLLRNKESITLPTKDNMTEYLSVTYSIPEEIIKILRESLTDEAIESIGKAALIERPVTVRVNTYKTTPNKLKEKLINLGITVKPVPDFGDVFFISGMDSLESIDAFNEGEFFVQDLASIKAIDAIGIKPNDTILDVCAAPGGKSISASLYLEGKGSILSRDLTDRKVALIEDNIERLSIDLIKTESFDALKYDDGSKEKFDVVIADLPCSGLGVIAKKPDIKYNITVKDVEKLSKLQADILKNVRDYVRPGGTLCFSTCTLTKKENDDNLLEFLNENKNYKLLEKKQIIPNEDEDGFFYAVLRKES